MTNSKHPTRVFVSGIGGFVGLKLIPFLHERGYRVFGTDVVGSLPLKSWIDQGKLTFFESRLSSAEDLKRIFQENEIDAVIHMAAVRQASTFSALYETNVMITARVLEAIQDSRRPIQYVQVSSSAVYGEPLSHGALDESSPLRPITPYGASKAAADIMALQWGKESSSPAVILRPFNLIGRGQSPAFFCPKVMKQLSEIMKTGGGEFQLGGLDSYRDFLDARDFIRGLTLALEKGEPGEIYHVCSGRATCLSEVVDFAMKKLGRTVPVQTSAQNIVLKSNVSFQVGSFAKLNALSGWKPEVSLSESLEDIFAGFATSN